MPDGYGPLHPFFMFTADCQNEIEPMRDAINRKVKSEMPAEKARAREEQTRIAQKLAREGSRYVPGIGQKMGSIDRRTYFRHELANPGCMRDETYINELLRDSPKLRAPGYTPRVSRSPTFVKTYK